MTPIPKHTNTHTPLVHEAAQVHRDRNVGVLEPVLRHGVDHLAHVTVQVERLHVLGKRRPLVLR